MALSRRITFIYDPIHLVALWSRLRLRSTLVMQHYSTRCVPGQVPQKCARCNSSEVDLRGF